MDLENKKKDRLSTLMEQFYKKREELTHEDYDYLINQLQIHQTELEMQNDELRNAKIAIEDSRNKYLELYDFAPISYVTIDSSGIIKEANLTSVNIFGKGRSYLINLPFTLFIDIKDHERFNKCLRELIFENSIRKCELRFKNKNGENFDAVIEGHSVKNSLGEIIIKIAITDISEQKRTEEALKIMVEKAEQANSAKSNFLANMSHELRTPLNGILGFSDFLINEEENSDKKELLEMIKQSGQNLLAIINDILDISKIEAGMMKVTNEIFDIDTVVESMGKSFSELCKARKNTLKIIKKYKSTRLIGDELKLSQILINLIGNANKFTENGNLILEITEIIQDSKISYFIFKIIDTGIGITEEKMKHLFEKFDQGEDTITKKYGGTGLGLAIVKELTTLMKGIVSAESEVGVGTTFLVSIPFRRLREENAFTGNEFDESKIWKNLNYEGKSVLVVDDNEANIKLTEVILKQTKIDFDVAFDGEEALNKIEHKKYDLVLMDLQMPVMNGIDTVRIIREREIRTGKRVTIIALSAYATAEKMETALMTGFDDYLPKPFVSKDLLRIVTKWIEA